MHEDAVKVDNDEDTSVGTMLSDNRMTITAGDDGIHALGDLIIDSGTQAVAESVEGLEGNRSPLTEISLIYATDDGGQCIMPMPTKMKFFTMNGGTSTLKGQGIPIQSTQTVMSL